MLELNIPAKAVDQNGNSVDVTLRLRTLSILRSAEGHISCWVEAPFYSAIEIPIPADRPFDPFGDHDDDND